MRIIAGSRKGARILAPKGLDTRPTGDRVREAVFNLVGPVDGAEVLDLYAGSGAMGLEALSRGAARVTFVESERAAAETILANLDKLRLEGAVVLRDDAARKLAADVAGGRRYDLVLVDPPYRMLPRILPTLASSLPAVVRSDGLVVVESGAREEPELPLPKRTSRRYGAARVTLFEGIER
ncbi:MAG TPA: 16S rRNA (guanine(966)-N(2))-methyltransferase RsmD [Gaiellaceae bacterium]|nr:16S rRNA (guanine(966)-N(2))-methyltransferase RsmD [Gaiellaceae bacterium]